ncbi:permease [Draconibacterium halophilum]|uniref:Heavy metal-associated domain-containing protein n=1 Tax=Draconibacterium halophilum TaxID=2706887 RepID=A0A6C0RCY5_9BACT|nr:permease [Draconibacterium halophilum]QIA08364.1 heavy metal-associated domain-containing protein [Draconibacterium halophilum]
MNIEQYIVKFLGDFAIILGEMAPYLLLGFFFAGLLYAFIPREKINKYFNGSPFRSSVFSSLFGIPLPLCSCGVIPTGAALYKNGASKGGTVSFMISTPQTGVDSILATFSLMGLPFAIIRPLAALITGISGGLITSAITKNENVQQHIVETDSKPKTLTQKIKNVFQYGFVEFIQDISKWLIIGLVLAAIISALIPNDFFELLNLSPILQMLLILVVSVPLYICATGSIPLAAILILKGISPGAAFVLLMAGPATNAATITMIGKVLGKKSLFTYLGTIIVGALGSGLIIDYLLPVHWFTEITQQHLGHDHGGYLAWWQIGSGILLLGLIVNGYIQKYRNSKQNSETQLNNNTMEVKTIKVDGMTCNHCKANVETNLQKLAFVENAAVNLANKTVTLEGDDIDMDKVKETVESIGYKAL